MDGKNNDLKKDLRSRIQSFGFKDGTTQRVDIGDRVRISKPSRISKTNLKLIKKNSKPTQYEDLPPSLREDLSVVFIGFNPGIQSSLSQHHYAHHSNLFWKLFNQSGLVFTIEQVKKFIDDDDLFICKRIKKRIPDIDTYVVNELHSVYSSHFSADDDYELLKVGIGFTDLVLRCTKTAAELTIQEKLDNVPRLINELKESKPKFIVIVGKGIWECIVQYLHGKPLKLLEGGNFKWGLQSDIKDSTYKAVMDTLHSLLGYQCSIHVFTNTSGLAASLKYHQKLDQWTSLASSIYREENHGNKI
ncbi:hypothetical protein CAAN1_22S00760 [[Candida] anglica]|uniref:Uracil-DNA glycosylase-like domain-containing protein n=1 Tax=[Candida] anglica TaxID=148631 RepID=A0ABP0EMR5_9ASCO